MDDGCLTLRIDSRLDQVYLVGLSLRAIGAAVGLDDDGAGALELCVVEAVNNCIEHAYRGEPDHSVEIVLTLAAGELRIEVCDRGTAMDWSSACARAAALAEDCYAEGGRGLFIMQSLMDEVRYASRDGGNALTLVKRLPAPAPALARAGGRGLESG